jgi:predicted Zn-dependent peptidase
MFIADIIVDTSKPDEFIEEIKKDLSKINITEENFLRKKKLYLSDMLLNFEKISDTNDFIVYYVNKFKKPLTNLYTIIKNLNYEEFNYLVKQINIDNISILKAKK